ncbi:MAG: choice-of-anchor L domain-containing protein [Saprospiraceae bacterium]
MRVFTPRRFFGLFISMLSVPLVLTGQVSNDSPIVVDGHLQRHVISAGSASQLLTFENLIVGETFSLIVPDDPALNGCIPALSAENADTKVLSYDAAVHQLKFVVSDKTMTFRLDYPCTWDAANPPRHYVSIICETCVKKDLNEYLKALAVLDVTPGGSADQLVREVMIGGDCFDISNVTYSGQPGQIGTFSNGQTNIGFASGMIMATGDASVAVGPNGTDNASAGFGNSTPDGDLSQLSGSGSLFDLANIEFDFTPTQTPLTFDYVFASEEYCEYVGSQFNDAFGFFISGPGIAGPFSGGAANIASLGPGQYVAINNINHITNSGLYVNNQGASSGNLCGQTPSMGQAVNEVQFDGFTRKLTAVANVIPCETYHIKLKICDVGDGIFDSGVFLRAGSFDAGGNASVEWLVNDQPDVNEVYEGCGTVKLVFDRIGANMSSPLPVQFTVTGTATPGADYQPIPTTVVIPPGQDKLYITVPIYVDQLAEGAETITITLLSPCSCVNPEVTLIINDLDPLMAIPDSTIICGPGVGTVSVNPEGGVPPYSFNWNNGTVEQSTTQFVAISTNFQVTVTDACGKTSVATARITVTSPPTAKLIPPAPQLCPGQSATIQVTFTGTGPFELNYTLNGDQQSPVSGITDNPYFLVVDQPGLYQITSVIDAAGCEGSGQGVLLVTQSTLNMTGLVTNTTCSNNSNGSINTTVLGGQGPYTYAWNGPQAIPPIIPDPTGLQPGTYNVTVTDFFGCTNAQEFVIESPPALVANVDSVIGANCYNPSGGSIELSAVGGTPGYTYNWNNGFPGPNPGGLAPGTYNVTVTDVNGCSNTTSAAVPGDFTPPVAMATVPEPLSCFVTSITIDGTGSSEVPNFTYNWTASGGGNIVSGNDTPTPIVNQAGSYLLVVTNTDNGCTASVTGQVTGDYTPPVANAGPAQFLTCVVDSLQLNGSGSANGPNYTYFWTASNGGNIVSGDSSLTPLINQTGTYNLVVTNNTNGCTNTASTNVSLDVAPPTAVVAPGGQITCTNPNLQLNGTGSSAGPNFTYSWTASNGGAIGTGGNTLNPTVTASGMYTLVVTNTINGCTATAATNVTTNASVPTAVAASSGIITCSSAQVILNAAGSSSGPNYSYQWNTSNGQIVSGQGTTMLTVGSSGQYTLLVTNTNNSCTSTFTIDVLDDLALPTANAGTSQTLLCSQPSLTLDGSGSSTGPNFTYQWSASGNGNFITPTNIQNPGVDQPGTYQLLVTNTTNGCTSVAQVQILEDADEPVAQIVAPGILNCNVSQITIDASASSAGAAISYVWSGPGIQSGDSTLMPVVDAPGTYNLMITNATNGCTTQQSVMVDQDILNPPADAGPDLVLNCFNPQQQLGGSGNPTGANYTFAWTGSGIMSGGNTPNPVVDQGGTYTLLVTNTANGCTMEDIVALTEDFAPPQADAGPTFQLTCQEEIYTLQASGSQGANFAYQWTSPTGSFTTSPDILTPTVDAPGTYNLLITNTTNGCTSTSSVQITQAADIPVIAISNPAILTCAITDITLDGNGSSTGPEFSYQWTASNGGNIVSGGSTLNPIIDQPGTYTLLITNTTNDCESDAFIQVSEDVALPQIDAGQQQTLTCTVLSLNLAGEVTSAGNYSYQWTPSNGGNVVSGGNTLSPLVDATGDYALLVTNLQNGCTSTDQVSINADQVDPVAAILPPAILTCTTDQIPLDANGSSIGTDMTYTWTTSGGNYVDMTNDLLPIVDQPGSYTLLVTDTGNGCTQSISVEVGQDIENPVADAGTNGLLTCAVTSLQLDGSGSSQTGGNFSYLWSAANGGQIVNGGNSLTPTIGAGGEYTLTVQDLDNGCTSTDIVQVAVDTDPPAVLIANPPTITCTQLQVTLNGSGSQGGPNITYAWTTQGGTIISGQNTTQAIVSATGNYTLTVFNNATGCTNTASVAVTDDIVLPEAEAGDPFTLTCSVNQVTLQGDGSSGGSYAYAWSTQGGSIVSGSSSLNPVVNQQGVYTLTVTNLGTGCTNTDLVEVFLEMNVPTDFTIELTPPSCKDNDGVITFEQVTGGYGPYLYSINNGQTFLSKLDFTKISPGTYDLWIQDANGCEFHKTLNVPKAPDPAVDLVPQLSIDLGDSLQLEAVLPPGYPLALIDTVIWTPLIGLTFESNSIPDLLTPTAKPFKPTEYKVTVISGDGCEASDRVLIRVDNEPHIYIPNAFSPWDEDGENDVVYIFADNNQVRLIKSFQIFDRWGEQVFIQQNFLPNDPANGWNGRLRGKLLIPAVFVYYAEIELVDGRTLLYKGDITIVK